MSKNEQGKQSTLGEGNSIVYLFRNTWRYSDNRPLLVTYWVLFILANIISLTCYPLAIAKIVNTIQQQGITRGNIIFLFGLLLTIPLTNFVFWCFHGPGRSMESNNGFKCRANYWKYLFKGVMTLPLQWHADHHSGDTIDKVEKGSNALYNFSSEQTFMVIRLGVQLIVSYTMLAWFSPPSAIIVFAIILLSGWITMRFDKVIVGNFEKLNHAENKITAQIFDHISNIVTVVILRVEKLVIEAVQKKIDEPFVVHKKNRILIETKWFLVSMCGSIMMVAVLAVYFWQNMDAPQGILMGSVFLLIQYLDKVTDAFFDFTSIYGDVIYQRAKIRNAEELIIDFREETLVNHLLPRGWQEMSINNLNFSYHGLKGEKLHLDNLSLSIKRKQRIAFVGKSGGGKSTSFKLLMGLYDPTSADVSVDGVHIPNGLQGICRDIALVPQDPEIFETTIRGNITMGAEATGEEVIRYADMACFTEVVESLPKGLDSAINEKGVNLSVGQKQRLALARGLFVCRNKSVLLLDEPTSSLDSIDELKIYQNIFREFGDTSVVSSIHRLHLLPLFDYIYVFDKGKIIASGTLNQLLKTCPKFIQMWESYQHRMKDETDLDEG